MNIILQKENKKENITWFHFPSLFIYLLLITVKIKIAINAKNNFEYWL